MNRHFRENNYDNYEHIVNEMIKRVAENAFASDRNQRIRDYCFETGANILEQLKSFSQQPLVKEALIISVTMLLKGGLWFAYRKAAENDLEITDL